MSIKVTMTGTDGNVTQMDFRGWIECAAWLERHHGEYTAVDAHEISADQIRQGRKGNRTAEGGK